MTTDTSNDNVKWARVRLRDEHGREHTFNGIVIYESTTRLIIDQWQIAESLQPLTSGE